MWRGQGVRLATSTWQGVDFVLPSGKQCIVSGPNGSGKSTLLRVLGGLLPSEGYVSLRGKRYCPYSAFWRRRVLYLGALQAGEVHACAYSYWRRQYFADQGRRIPLPLLDFLQQRLEIRRSGIYSLGEEQRIRLGILWLSRRPIWLLDDIYQHMDTDWQEVISALLDRHCAHGGWIIRTQCLVTSAAVSIDMEKAGAEQ